MSVGENAEIEGAEEGSPTRVSREEQEHLLMLLGVRRVDAVPSNLRLPTAAEVGKPIKILSPGEVAAFRDQLARDLLGVLRDKNVVESAWLAILDKAKLLHSRHVESRAIVACGPGGGVVLWAQGPDIEHLIDVTSTNIDDLGLDGAPQGMSLWRGCYVGGTDETDPIPRGVFEDLTDEDWRILRSRNLTAWTKAWEAPGKATVESGMSGQGI